MIRVDWNLNLGQLVLALSFLAGGVSAAAAFIYGMRADLALLSYRMELNEQADKNRVASADVFRKEIIDKLEAIRTELAHLRAEMQEKEPRKR